MREVKAGAFRVLLAQVPVHGRAAGGGLRGGAAGGGDGAGGGPVPSVGAVQ